MIEYSGMIKISDGSEKEYEYGDVGPNFTFGEVQSLIDECFQDQVLEKTIREGHESTIIAFFQCSNHERGLREALFNLFTKLAELGTGIDAYCSLWDSEANSGKGGVWDLRLRDPDDVILGLPFEQIDFTKRDWT